MQPTDLIVLSRLPGSAVLGFVPKQIRGFSTFLPFHAIFTRIFVTI